MSPESFSAKLNRIYGATPSREYTHTAYTINQEYSTHLDDVAQQLGTDNLYLIEKVFFPKGTLIEEKLEKFISSLEQARDKYGDDLVMFLTPECVRNCGSINHKRLRQLLKNTA